MQLKQNIKCSSANIVLLAGAIGVLIGTLGIRLGHDSSWVSIFDNLHWTASTLAAAIAAWLIARKVAPRDSEGLFWIALGLSGYAIGQILWDIQVVIAYADFPAPSDLFYLCLGPCVTIGLLKEIGSNTSKSQRRTIWLDTTTLTIALLTLVLALYLPKRGNTAWLPMMVLVAYPTTLLAAAITALSMIPALRLRLNASLIVFIAGLIWTGLSWMNWNFLALDGVVIDGAWFNISFSVAVLLIAYSLTRWKIEVNDDPRWDRQCESILRLLPLVTVVIASLSVVLSHTLADLPFFVQVTSDSGAVIVVLLAMIRQSSLMKERDQLVSIQSELIDSQRTLAQERGMLKSLVSTIPDLIWLKDSDGVFLSCNPMFEKLYGHSEQEIVGKTDYDFVDSALADFFRENDRAAMEAKVSRINEEQLTFAIGGYCGQFETIKTPMYDDQGELIGVLGVARDITERKRAEDELKMAGQVYECSSEAIMVTDERHLIISVNQAFTDITGYSRDEVLGKNPSIFKSGRHDASFYKAMWDALLATGRWQGEIWNRKKNNEIFPELISINVIRNADGSIYRHIAQFIDITERKKSEELIWSQANFDTLTKLPNRQLFQDRLVQEIRKTHRTEHMMALLFIDLDHFKDINDTLGHQAGDELLIEAAQRIVKCVRDTDTVARLGGDEFTVILSELSDASQIDRITQCILKSLAEPFSLEMGSAYVSASIGITLCPIDAVDAETLLMNADQAMYQAKDFGKNRYCYFTAALQENALNRLALLTSLRGALANNQFRLHFQPIVELSTGDVFKAEALIRWHHPDKGMVSPADFIPLAEETGLINDIGNWVFLETCHWALRWNSAIAENFQISINKSPVQFQDTELIDKWLSHLKDIGLSGKSINIEITEGLLLEQDAGLAEKMLKLRDADIQVSIDDFGTGYSALSYLNKFDIDFLKIDQSFVRQIEPDSSALALCEAIIIMAHRLGLKVIAEGVETEQQRELLLRSDCDFGQGYLFSRPIPPDEFEQYLLQHGHASEMVNEQSNASKLT